MTNDVAIFLDLDNLVIGAKQVNLSFDINLVLEHIKKITDGRIVLRNAYGAGKQSQGLLQELAQAGFIVQSATRINSFSKNLADMQIVVNAMDTLVDGHQYNTYVLMSGDRDFTPLVQSLRKRGKHVIGVGIRRTSSGSLVELCDEYLFYEDLIPKTDLTDRELEQLVMATRDALLADNDRVLASVFQEHITTSSDGRFNKNVYPQGSFSKFLQRYSHLISITQENNSTYVSTAESPDPSIPLSTLYRTALKKQRLRVVLPQQRFVILRSLIDLLSEHDNLIWYEVLNKLYDQLSKKEDLSISKNQINALLLVARQAGVIRTLKGRSLSTAPVMLDLDESRAFQEAVICVDNAYLNAILELPEPFDFSQAALALYESTDYETYLRRIAQI